MDGVDLDGMERLGARLAAGLSRIVDERSAGPCVSLYLSGPLGSGKTTLTRALLRALGVGGSVRSPTYTLVEPYEVGLLRIYHFDAYRLADPEELELIGARDYFAEPGLCIVEWPERAAGWLPPADLHLCLSFAGHARSVRFAHCSPDAAHLAELDSAVG